MLQWLAFLLATLVSNAGYFFWQNHRKWFFCCCKTISSIAWNNPPFLALCKSKCWKLVLSTGNWKKWKKCCILEIITVIVTLLHDKLCNYMTVGYLKFLADYKICGECCVKALFVSRSWQYESRGGGGTSLHGLYRYVWPQRVWFFSYFGHK